MFRAQICIDIVNAIAIAVTARHGGNSPAKDGHLLPRYVSWQPHN